MSKSLILVRLTLGWEDVGAVRGYLREMQAALSPVTGFLGSGAWKGVQDPHARLVLFLYESPEAASRGLVAIEEVPTLIERQSMGAMPADVKVLKVLRSGGTFLSALRDDVLVSLSVRLSEPGYGPEMVEEYEDVFSGLATMPGYAGMLIGSNVKGEDEVAGLAAWRNEEAFTASLPVSVPYAIDLYEPLGEA